MDTVSLHASIPDFSRLIYGLWRLADDSDTSTSHIREKIDACLGQGITTFDHADIYGGYRCEALFGQALAEDPTLRSQMQLVSKCDIAIPCERYPERRVKYYDTSPDYITQSVENSLTALHTDYLDLLLIHRPDPFMDADATGAALDRLIEQGKIRAAGVSNFGIRDWDLLQSRMHHPLVTNQIEISLLERSAFTDGRLSHLQQHHTHAMAWSPLAGGRLFSKDSACDRVRSVLERVAAEHQCGADHVALAWLLAHPAKILPVVGTNNVERINRISECLQVVIDRETWFELWVAAAGEELP